MEPLVNRWLGFEAGPYLFWQYFVLFSEKMSVQVNRVWPKNNDCKLFLAKV